MADQAAVPDPFYRTGRRTNSDRGKQGGVPVGEWRRVVAVVVVRNRRK